MSGAATSTHAVDEGAGRLACMQDTLAQDLLHTAVIRHTAGHIRHTAGDALKSKDLSESRNICAGLARGVLASTF